MRDIHDRQPVIIQRSQENYYLDKRLEDRESLEYEGFQKYPVTKKMSDANYQKENAVEKINSLDDF